MELLFSPPGPPPRSLRSLGRVLGLESVRRFERSRSASGDLLAARAERTGPIFTTRRGTICSLRLPRRRRSRLRHPRASSRILSRSELLPKTAARTTTGRKRWTLPWKRLAIGSERSMSHRRRPREVHDEGINCLPRSERLRVARRCGTFRCMEHGHATWYRMPTPRKRAWTTTCVARQSEVTCSHSAERSAGARRP